MGEWNSQHGFELLGLAVDAKGGEILISFKDHHLIGSFGSREDTVGQGTGFVVANPIAVIAGGGQWSVRLFQKMRWSASREETNHPPNDKQRIKRSPRDKEDSKEVVSICAPSPLIDTLLFPNTPEETKRKIKKEKGNSPNDLDQLLLIIGAILCDKLCQDCDGGLGGLGGASGDEAGGRVPSSLVLVLCIEVLALDLGHEGFELVGVLHVTQRCRRRVDFQPQDDRRRRRRQKALECSFACRRCQVAPCRAIGRRCSEKLLG